VDPAVETEIIEKCIAEHGCTQSEIASAAKLSSATVSRRVNRQSDAAGPGRPSKLPNHHFAWLAQHKIVSTAGRLKVRGLKRLFPSVARSWLKRAVSRTRSWLEALRKQALWVLHWCRPGSVWALDFTWPDGRQGCPCVVVRDLASTKTLLAEVLDGEATEDVVPVLLGLFEKHGPPLVLKIDNGSGLRSDAMKSFLESHAVRALYSPPYTPSYNGGCERGNGHLKSVARDLRLLDDPQAPLCDYLDGAAEVIDQQLVTRCGRTATRRELWEQRKPCTAEMRREFHAHYLRFERKQREVRELAEDAILGHPERASLDRYAIRDALCEMKLLKIRRP